MSQGSTDLVPVGREGARPRLLEHFVLPLLRGQQVSIGVPLGKSHLDEIIAAVMTGDDSIKHLQFELQAMASRLVAHPVMIELGIDDVKLMAAAYQVCWFFHTSPEKEKIWERRIENIVEETMALVQTVDYPRNEGQLLGRHLLLRHMVHLLSLIHI